MSRKQTGKKSSGPSDRKLFLIAGSIAVAAVALAAVIVFVFLHRKPAAAFYGLPEHVQEAVAEELPGFTLITYNASLPLKQQLSSGRKPDIIFMYNGASADDAAAAAQKRKASAPSSLLDGMISSARMAVRRNENGSVAAVPLLLDNYEIDVNISLLRKQGKPMPGSWIAIDTFVRATAGRTAAPVVMAGGDDRELINITGALCEALQGGSAWSNVTAKIREASAAGRTSESDFESLVAEMCAGQDAPLFGAERLLSGWHKAGILYPETFHMKKTDVNAFMENNMCAVSFMTLSQHRTVAQESIGGYDSQYYPSSPDASGRNFTAPMIIGVPLSRNRQAAQALALMAGKDQEKLSRTTGLAPVQAESRVPDKQADDVRYWVAASGEPLPALSDAAFKDDAERAAFAQALRSQIMYK